MTEQIEVKQKNKGGRPRKEKTGKHIWIPAEYVAMVQAILDVGKQQNNQQVQS
jgi:hypothetical protein